MSRQGKRKRMAGVVVGVRNGREDGTLRDRQDWNLPGGKESRDKNRQANLLTMNDVDRRAKAYRDMRATVRAVSADLGGADRLSHAQTELIKRAAVIGALLEAQEASWMRGEEFHLAEYMPLLNAQQRLYKQLGMNRIAREVKTDLKTYLQQKA